MGIDELYSDFYSDMLSYCASLTKNRSAAEDLTQEAYIKAMIHWAGFQDLDRKQCRAWLRKTARNLFIDQYRRQSRETPVEEENFPVTPFEEDYSIPEVLQCIGRLPEKERTLFHMRYFQGYNSAELGKIFSLPPATVRSRLSSAKKRLRDMLKD